MREFFSTTAVLGSTLAWLALFFAVKPFDRVRDVLDQAFGAAPAWTQVEDMVRDPYAADVSRSGAPLESFRTVASFWSRYPGARKIILMGNSQSLLTSLAAGEPPPSEPEKTYSDIIAGRFREAGSKRLFYRLSAGALSYEEMLWYAAYLSLKPELKPDVLLVQLNYQNFMNAGIRGGMLELLSDPAFRASVEQIAHTGGPDSFAKAVQEYASASTRVAVSRPAEVSPGERTETAVREKLDGIPAFGLRGRQYLSFLEMMTRGRTYFLHLGLMTKRSLKGSRVNSSRAALERLAQHCTQNGIQVILFQAATNPEVPLYATEEDDRDYHGFANSLAARYGLKIFDFEHSIPARHWGKALNLPDPLHLSRAGHRLMADLMIATLEQNGI
jgi:hypothetical protein